MLLVRSKYFSDEKYSDKDKKKIAGAATNAGLLAAVPTGLVVLGDKANQVAEEGAAKKIDKLTPGGIEANRAHINRVKKEINVLEKIAKDGYYGDPTKPVSRREKEFINKVKGKASSMARRAKARIATPEFVVNKYDEFKGMAQKSKQAAIKHLKVGGAATLGLATLAGLGSARGIKKQKENQKAYYERTKAAKSSQKSFADIDSNHTIKRTPKGKNVDDIAYIPNDKNKEIKQMPDYKNPNAITGILGVGALGLGIKHAADADSELIKANPDKKFLDRIKSLNKKSIQEAEGRQKIRDFVKNANIKAGDHEITPGQILHVPNLDKNRSKNHKTIKIGNSEFKINLSDHVPSGKQIKEAFEHEANDKAIFKASKPKNKAAKFLAAGVGLMAANQIGQNIRRKNRKEKFDKIVNEYKNNR